MADGRSGRTARCYGGLWVNGRQLSGRMCVAVEIAWLVLQDVNSWRADKNVSEVERDRHSAICMGMGPVLIRRFTL